MYPLSISDHACVRFIERVYGIDMDEVREKILSVEEFNTASKLTSTFNYKKDTHTAVVENGTVVTVLSSKMSKDNLLKGQCKCRSYHPNAAYKDNKRKEQSSLEHQ